MKLFGQLPVFVPQNFNGAKFWIFCFLNQFIFIMGLFFSDIFKRWFGNKDTRLLMLGLDAAGKTTVLMKLKLGEHVATIPTI